MSNLDVFRMRLEQLKEQGVDVDPEKLTQEIVEAHKELEKLPEKEKQKVLFELVRQKIMTLLDDYQNFYQDKGRKLQVIVRVKKENSADAFGENFVFSNEMEVISMIEIGTKGKYEKVIEEQ